METNAIVKLKKKLQALKIAIKQWVKDDKLQSNASKMFIQSRLADLDKIIDQGKGNEEAKIRWAIEGDENSKYFHGIINKKSSQLAIRGVLLDGDWIDDPSCVKNEFLKHFSNRFAPLTPKLSFQSQFPNRVTSERIDVLESIAFYDEIKRAVWDCGINKSPDPNGFSFEFYRKYWDIIDQDVVAVVFLFFSSAGLPPKALLNCFVLGLREDIQQELAILRPHTITQAISLAKLIEDKTNDQILPPQNSSLTAAPAPTFEKLAIKRLSPAEMQQRRVVGLCFN
nr:RNA-directed DNA polymerase, eukaryota [Tanacetum cinerariifolium]